MSVSQAAVGAELGLGLGLGWGVCFLLSTCSLLHAGCRPKEAQDPRSSCKGPPGPTKPEATQGGVVRVCVWLVVYCACRFELNLELKHLNTSRFRAPHAHASPSPICTHTHALALGLGLLAVGLGLGLGPPCPCPCFLLLASWCLPQLQLPLALALAPNPHYTSPRTTRRHTPLARLPRPSIPHPPSATKSQYSIQKQKPRP